MKDNEHSTEYNPQIMAQGIIKSLSFWASIPNPNKATIEKHSCPYCGRVVEEEFRLETSNGVHYQCAEGHDFFVAHSTEPDD